MKGQISLFDSHAHLYDAKFSSDRESLISGLRENNINHVMVPAEDAESSLKVMELACKYENIYCAIGLHPHHSVKFEDSMLEFFSSILQNKRIRAIGEIGLDYHYDFSPPEVQKKVFERFVSLAIETEKPVIVHNRKSEDDLISILLNTGANKIHGVIHCFDSDIETARKILDMGLMISFSGLVTFGKNDKLSEAVKYVPMDRMIIETDSPYLAPHPFRGKRNEPGYIKYVAAKIAEIKNISFDEVASITNANACSLFGIGN